MQDTTQIKGKSFEALSGNSGNLRDWTRSIVDFQKSTLEQHNMEKEAQKEADAKNLFVSSLNSKDHGVSQECNSTFRLYQVAKGIRNYFAKPENGGYDYTNVDDDVLYDGYVKNNPDRKAQLDRYVLDDSQICDPTQLYQDMGWEESEQPGLSTESSDSNAWANAAQSLIDIPMNLGKLPFNLIDKGTAWVAKQLSDNDEAIDQQLQQNLQQTEDFATLPGVNREDLSYQLPKLAEDLGVTIATSFIPGVGEAKWAEWAAKYPKLAKLIKSVGSVEKLAEKYPKLAPFLKGGEIGVKDTAVMNALEGEGTTPLEALEGWLAGGVIEKGTKWLKGLSTFLETNGLFTKSKAKEIITKLKDIGAKAPGKGTVDDLADFMTKHGLTGSRKQIIEKAEQLGKDKKAILNELLSQSKSTHSLEEADEAVELLLKRLETGLEDAPMLPREGDLTELNDLLQKQGNYSLSDLERIKEKIDDLLRLYNKNGTPKDSKSAELWRETRKTIQRYIEDVAKKENLGDVAMLNNEIQTAYGIADGISNKTMSDMVNNAIGEYGIYGAFGIPVVKDIWEGDYKSALKNGTMALFFGNTWFKTHLGSMLNRMSGTNRYEIDQWIASEGKNKLSEAASEEVANILNQDLGFKERAKQYITNFIKESAMIGGQKGTELAVDNMGN